MSPDRYELAWAAGFFDGEGCTGLYVSSKGGCNFPKITISQVNRVHLERFQRAVGGIGKIYGPYTRKGHPNKRPSYQFQTSKFETCQAIIAMLWPWLGVEKREQARKAMFAWNPIGHYQSLANKAAIAVANRRSWNDPVMGPRRAATLKAAREKSLQVMRGRPAIPSQLEALNRGRENRWAAYRAVKTA